MRLCASVASLPYPPGGERVLVVLLLAIAALGVAEVGRRTLRARASVNRDRFAHGDDAARFFDVSVDALCVIDADGTVTRANGAFDALMRDGGAAPIAVEDRRRLLDALNGARRGEAVEELLLVVNDVRGRDRSLLCNAVFAPETGAVYASLRDESDRRDASAALERTNRELESFAYTTSHDLRAPLISIEGFASSLERRYGDVLDARGIDYVRRIQANASSLQTLIDDLFEFARVSSGEQTVVDANALAREVVDEVSARLGGVDATVTLTTPIPPIRVHPTRFKQALSNLIENAVTYAAPAARVTVSATAAGGVVDVAVEDNGAGVAPGDRDKVFQLFVRGRSSTAVAPDGTGLGLALVRSIAEASGGTARYEDASGGGARFVLSFPQGGTP